MLDLVKGCTIKHGYRSDHSSVHLEIRLSEFQIGKGIWKLNNSLLSNMEYIDLITKATIDEKT